MTMPTILWSVLVAASLAVPPLATAATYYVATNGDNARSCSTAQNINTPKASVQNGIGCLSGGGDTLLIRGGTYNENIQSPSASGSSYSNPIWIGAYQNETVTIRGTGRNQTFIMSGGNYVIFDKLHIVAPSGMYYAVYGGEGNERFQNGEVTMEPFTCTDPWTSSPGGPSIFYGNRTSSSLEFLNNDLHDSPCSYSFYVHGSNLVIDGNRIYHNAGYGIQVYMNPEDGCCPDNITIKNNFIYNNSWLWGDQCGITFNQGHNGLIHNNVIYGNKCGIGVARRATDTRIYNNTLYNNGRNYVGLIIENTVNTTIRNNIVYLHGFYDPNPGTNTGLVSSNNLTDVDPRFVNAGANDFHLRSDSPAIDAGVDVGLPYSGPRPDIGAYEVGLNNGPGGTVGGSPSGPSRSTLPAPQNLRMVTP